ncbi:MAG: UDP-glucose 4-epimerase, partial [Actinotalea sp.]|nr:UDP-glucose 4-epimerase [Actinotalea sp.]
SGGPQPNDVLYNGEIGRALVHLALHPGPLPHRTFNIGSGRATTLDEFADAVRQVVPGAQISVGGGMGFEGFHDHGYGVLDISRLLSTGFPPPSDLVVQVEDYVRSVRAA